MTQHGRLYSLLQDDHARLDGLLRESVAVPWLGLDAYEQFRGGLLRHIAIEEKVLLPEARRLRGGEPLPLAKQLKADHAALAGLLVPTPTPAIVETIRGILAEHNPLEEGPGGLYDLCETLLGPGLEALIARVMAIPEVPQARHFDGPGAGASIERLMRARAALREK